MISPESLWPPSTIKVPLSVLEFKPIHCRKWAGPQVQGKALGEEVLTVLVIENNDYSEVLFNGDLQ